MPEKAYEKKKPYFINLRRVFSCYQFNFLEFLAVKSKFFENFLTNIRKEVFENDIKMAEVTNKDKVLLIGAGICPTHCVFITRKTNANVTGIDNSKGAVKSAKKYVEKQKLTDKIKIEYADGRAYPVENFNIIFIAINVYPIDSVLSHISKKTKNGTRILCKSINYDIQNILKKTDLGNYFKIEYMSNNPKTQTYLLVKK